MAESKVTEVNKARIGKLFMSVLDSKGSAIKVELPHTVGQRCMALSRLGVSWLGLLVDGDHGQDQGGWGRCQ
jgi:hypothetical protein